jgi:fatty-acyl-CoA synthase
MQTASPTTIPEALRRAGERSAGEFNFHLDDGLVSVSFGELVERAATGARRLIARGVQPGDVIGILGPNRPEWLVWAYAAWMTGAAITPMQIPLRIRRPEAFSEQLRALVETAGSRCVLADPRLAPLLPDGIGVPWEERGDQSREEPVGPTAESTAIVQFTSGSTAHPKGVVIRQAAVIAQLQMLYDHYFREGVSQTTVGWVPFFHDLGLITTVIFPTYALSTIELLPTERFARDPAEWLRVIDRTRGLGTLAPSSAFGKAIQVAERSGERIDLSSLIVAHFAAEGVDPQVAQRMATVATQKFGLHPDALGSTYGLAEAVLGVSYSEMGAGLRIDRVSLDQLTRGVAAPASDGPIRQIVSCGKPVMELRIAAPDLSALDEREVGEILVRGASVASGYLGSDADPFVEGWLRTGDLGYLADGELFVTGRAKDMIIAMGQNYYPEDFEWAAGRVPGVRAGRCVAFGKPDDTERVVVLVEPREIDADPEALKRDVGRSVRDSVGIAASEVVVLPRGTIEKTTSGKLRRAAMRGANAEGALTPVGGGVR